MKYEPLTPTIAEAISKLDDRLYEQWKSPGFWYTRWEIAQKINRFTDYVWNRYGMSPATIGFHVAGKRTEALCQHQHATYAGKKSK